MKREFSTVAEYLAATDQSISDLAERLGISRQRAAHYARRRYTPRGDMLLRLSKVTGVPIEKLVVDQERGVA